MQEKSTKYQKKVKNGLRDIGKAVFVLCYILCAARSTRQKAYIRTKLSGIQLVLRPFPYIRTKLSVVFALYLQLSCTNFDLKIDTLLSHAHARATHTHTRAHTRARARTRTHFI